MIYDDIKPKPDSILDGDFSCETTECMYEPSDDELLYPSKHYDYFDHTPKEYVRGTYHINDDGFVNYE